MLEIKKVIFITGLLILSCTSQNILEGRITKLESIDLNGLKSVDIVFFENQFEQHEFYVDKNNRLEDINIDFTYSHIKSHMLDGEKVEIVFEIKNSKKIIKSFKFLDHSH
ncbi:MAG: hypothetical protein VX521_01320 [Chloroflexota bacterium]|nr:hypothetical protein [Chloroflexota bacterium]